MAMEQIFLDPVQPLPSWPLAGSNLSYLIGFLPGGLARFAIFSEGQPICCCAWCYELARDSGMYVQGFFAEVMIGLGFYWTNQSLNILKFIKLWNLP